MPCLDVREGRRDGAEGIGEKRSGRNRAEEQEWGRKGQADGDREAGREGAFARSQFKGCFR